MSKTIFITGASRGFGKIGEKHFSRLIKINKMNNQPAFQNTAELKNLFQQYPLPYLDDLLTKLAPPIGKKSFLVFRDNKYINVLTENIAFFYVKYESSMIRSFDGQEYFMNHSLNQIQSQLSEKQFFRLNRQYLVNFNAIKEVEHYFARKLLINLVIPTKDKLLVSKEKVSGFLYWLDDR
jgi:two-component system response regulator LytT